MKLQVLLALLFLTTFLSAQTPDPKQPRTVCSEFLRMSWTRDAGMEDESLDTVSVCEEGKAFAKHVFPTPSFGSAQPEKTTWEYQNELSKETVVDLRKFLNRSDVLALSKAGEIKVKGKYAGMDGSLEISVGEDNPKIWVVRGTNYFARGPEWFELPDAVRDTICMYTEVFSRAKTGEHPPLSDDCRSLHELAGKPVPAG